MKSLPSACAIALLSSYPASVPSAADSRSVHAEPQFFTREFANSAVVVLRIRIPPHASIPQHDVSPRVVVWLTDAHLKLTFPDGTTREENHRAGQTSWVTPAQHAGENLGDQAIEFIAVIPVSATRKGDSPLPPRAQ
jgi:quercetin dioxygenase-like cupin family protein